MPKDSHAAMGHRGCRLRPRTGCHVRAPLSMPSAKHPLRLGPPAAALAARPVASHLQDGGPLDPGERIEEDVETLALLVASEEQHHRRALLLLGTARPTWTLLHVDAVEEDLELAAARGAARFSCAVLRAATRMKPAPDLARREASAPAPTGSPRAAVRPSPWSGRTTAPG